MVRNPQRGQQQGWQTWAAAGGLLVLVVAGLGATYLPSKFAVMVNQNGVVTDPPDFWSHMPAGPGGGGVTSVGLSAPGIFSVSGSPVTTAGTLGLNLANQSVNQFWSGPVSGGASAPTFRVISPLDFAVNVNSGLFLSLDVNTNFTWSSPAGAGTVTSVGLSAPAIFTVSGSPVVASGTLSLSLANQSANVVFAGPASGAAAAPTFRGLTLASADYANQGTTTTLLHGNAAGNPSFGAVVTGDITDAAVTLAKQANLAANSVIGNNTGSPAVPLALTTSAVLDMVGNTRGAILERGASGWALLNPGSANQIFIANGAGADPSWATTLPTAAVPALTGDITTPGGSLATTLKNTGTAGTYTKVTFDGQGRETSGASATLASADFANQGTTTTVLHGNAAGNPSFGAVVTGDIQDAAVTLAKQANLAANSVEGNNTGSPAAPAALTASQVLDIIGSTRGAILERGASAWVLISPGTSGNVLTSAGAGADPTYAAGINQVNAGATIGSADGSALTNLTYKYTTNAIPALLLSWGKAYQTNIAANWTAALAAPANAFYESLILMVTNSSGSDFKVTMPGGVWGTPGSGTPPVYWCTNKQLTKIVVEHYGQMHTNSSKVDYAP